MVSKSRAETQNLAEEFPIAKLISATGASREMIKYYLRNELLPPPSKPRRNLSLYSDRHIKLIILIRRFQEETRLSLPEIGKVFKLRHYEPHSIELYLLTGERTLDEAPTSLKIEEEVASQILSDIFQEPTATVALEFDDAFIEALRNVSLISSGQELSIHDQKIAGLIWSAQELGVPLEYFVLARGKLNELADLQTEYLKAHPRPNLRFNEALSIHYSADKIINRWLVSEKTALLRSRYREVIDSVDRGLESVFESIYLPSEPFLKRHKVRERLSELKANIANLDYEQLASISASCVFLADYDSAHAFVTRGLELKPKDSKLLAIRCFTFSLEQKLGEAERCYQLLSKQDDKSIWAIEAKILFLLLEASRMGGISDPSSKLGTAYEMYTQIPSTTADPMGKIEILLIRGRARSMFPQWVSLEPITIPHLKELLALLSTGNKKSLGLPIPASEFVYRAYAHFYLGRMNELENKLNEAAAHYEEVLKIDPASNLSAYAYTKLK